MSISHAVAVSAVLSHWLAAHKDAQLVVVSQKIIGADGQLQLGSGRCLVVKRIDLHQLATARGYDKLLEYLASNRLAFVDSDNKVHVNHKLLSGQQVDKVSIKDKELGEVEDLAEAVVCDDENWDLLIGNLKEPSREKERARLLSSLFHAAGYRCASADVEVAAWRAYHKIVQRVLEGWLDNQAAVEADSREAAKQRLRADILKRDFIIMTQNQRWELQQALIAGGLSHALIQRGERREGDSCWERFNAQLFHPLAAAAS